MSINNQKMYEETMSKKLDIKGKVCPMTFVHTKLTLEELNQGDILEVILDFPPAAKNIPENCIRQNIAELIEKEELDSENNIWLLKLKKL